MGNRMRALADKVEKENRELREQMDEYRKQYDAAGTGSVEEDLDDEPGMDWHRHDDRLDRMMTKIAREGLTEEFTLALSRARSGSEAKMGKTSTGKSLSCTVDGPTDF